LLNVDFLPTDHYAVFRAITKFSQVDRDELYKALGLHPRRPRAGGKHRVCTAQEFRDIIRGRGLIAVNRTGKGIPQGSPISAVLSNIYLLEFDARIQALVSAQGGFYRRYCDDLLVVMPTAELRAEMLATIRTMLSGLGLEAHPDKTACVDFAFVLGIGCIGFLVIGAALGSKGRQHAEKEH
jgi:RNA-directed DNA polymerase